MHQPMRYYVSKEIETPMMEAQKGDIAIDPQAVDATVKRAWEAIYDWSLDEWETY